MDGLVDLNFILSPICFHLFLLVLFFPFCPQDTFVAFPFFLENCGNIGRCRSFVSLVFDESSISSRGRREAALTIMCDGE